jgi:prophage tail gpP-like protein
LFNLEKRLKKEKKHRQILEKKTKITPKEMISRENFLLKINNFKKVKQPSMNTGIYQLFFLVY